MLLTKAELHNGSNVFLIYTLSLRLQFLAGEEIVVKATELDSVEFLREKVASEKEIRKDCVVLLYERHALLDGQKLHQIGLKSNSLINVVIDIDGKTTMEAESTVPAS